MVMQTLEEVLANHKRVVTEYVLNSLPETHTVEEIRLLYEMMRDYPSRPGKGLRSSLCILTCEALGGRTEDTLITAAALELFHNWILIHDDVEDRSQIRRGQPVLHAKYSVPLSINTGDALHGRTWGVLLENEGVLGAQRTLRLAKEFLKMTYETTEGQHMELSWIEKNTWDLRETDYFLLVEKKTAWYTCVSPCRMGAIIAGAQQKEVEALVPFGLSLGTAFQITDDLLNLVGDEKKYGKEGGGDIAEGKRTLLLIRLLETCPPRDRGRVLEVLGRTRNEKTPDDIEFVIDLMRRHGVLDHAAAKASEFASRARSQFDRIFETAPNKAATATLSQLIDYMVKREW